MYGGNFVFQLYTVDGRGLVSPSILPIGWFVRGNCMESTLREQKMNMVFKFQH